MEEDKVGNLNTSATSMMTTKSSNKEYTGLIVKAPNLGNYHAFAAEDCGKENDTALREETIRISLLYELSFIIRKHLDMAKVVRYSGLHHTRLLSSSSSNIKHIYPPNRAPYHSKSSLLPEEDKEGRKHAS